MGSQNPETDLCPICPERDKGLPSCGRSGASSAPSPAGDRPFITLHTQALFSRGEWGPWAAIVFLQEVFDSGLKARSDGWAGGSELPIGRRLQGRKTA